MATICESIGEVLLGLGIKKSEEEKIKEEMIKTIDEAQTQICILTEQMVEMENNCKYLKAQRDNTTSNAEKNELNIQMSKLSEEYVNKQNHIAKLEEQRKIAEKLKATIESTQIGDKGPSANTINDVQTSAKIDKQNEEERQKAMEALKETLNRGKTYTISRDDGSSIFETNSDSGKPSSEKKEEIGMA